MPNFLFFFFYLSSWVNRNFLMKGSNTLVYACPLSWLRWAYIMTSKQKMGALPKRTATSTVNPCLGGWAASTEVGIYIPISFISFFFSFFFDCNNFS